MFVIKNYVTTGGTVACALAIGYLMQNDTALHPKADPVSDGVAVASAQSMGLVGLEGVVLTSASPSQATIASVPRSSLPLAVQPRPSSNCNLSARATTIADANVRLRVKASCNAEEVVEIHHSGLIFSAMTDASGRLDIDVPALSEYAIFLISMEDQNGTVATTHVPELTQFERVALQWRGETDLQLHALEFGASYGEDGHVWSGAESGGAGSVTHLGFGETAQARNIEVYSFPTHSSEDSGAIELSVEAEVTEANCGQNLDVLSLQLRADQRLQTLETTLNIPDCDAVGDFLVLNNLFQDLTIAAK